MEEKEPENDTGKVSLYEFRHNLGLLLDTRYSPSGLQISHVEIEYNHWFKKCSRVNLNCLETHEKSWIGLFKNEVLLNDRFFVSKKNGSQYVRSKPDKLAEESKELFNFANYTEFQQWKRRQGSDENKTEAGTPTDSMNPNSTVVQQSTNHSVNCEFMLGMPPVVTTPPEDDDPKTTTEADEQNELYSGVSDCFRVSSDPNCQNSSESASTEFLQCGRTETIYEFKKQEREESTGKVKIKMGTTDFKIEQEETCDDGDLLEYAPIEPLEPCPSTSPAANSTDKRGESTSHYPDDYQYETSVESQQFPGDQTLDVSNRHFSDVPQNVHVEEYVGSTNTNTSSANTNTKRKLTNDPDDYEHRRAAKSPRLHERQHTVEENLPLGSNMEPGQSTRLPTTRPVEHTNNVFDYDEGPQHAESGPPIGDVSNISEHPLDQLPKYIRRSDLVTGINMSENLLVQLTGLVKGTRSVRILQGSSSKSALRDTWAIFPLQNKGLGIYLSDRVGTPFYWNYNRWDPNVPIPNPTCRCRPPELKLPPNSLFYGEIVEADYVSGRRDPFPEFNVIDIAALDGTIFKEDFYRRITICKDYLQKKQSGQVPKIFVTMKPVGPLKSFKSLNILRSAYALDGAFHMNRSKTSVEVTGIGLFQQCSNRDMSGLNEFTFSMDRRYILQVPSPSSSTPSLEKCVWRELSKIFKDIQNIVQRT